MDFWRFTMKKGICAIVVMCLTTLSLVGCQSDKKTMETKGHQAAGKNTKDMFNNAGKNTKGAVEKTVKSAEKALH